MSETGRVFSSPALLALVRPRAWKGGSSGSSQGPGPVPLSAQDPHRLARGLCRLLAGAREARTVRKGTRHARVVAQPKKITHYIENASTRPSGHA
jgi:hypothetical protein